MSLFSMHPILGHLRLYPRLLLSLGAGVLFVSAVAASTMAMSFASDGDAQRLSIHRLAQLARSGWTEASLSRVLWGMEPGAAGVAARFAPSAGPQLKAAEGALSAEPPPQVFSARAIQTMTWDAARLVNASIPFSAEPNPPAHPLRLTASASDYDQALQCLADAIYYEAAFEPRAGQEAVAQVVLNRMRHRLYPKTVCGVIYQGSELPTGCQFSFTCDGSLTRAPVAAAWKRGREVAERALNGYVAASVGEATHYHAEYVVPYWLPTLTKVSKIGAHIFYRWPGGMGLPGAFGGQYAGNERVPRIGASTLPAILVSEADKPHVVTAESEREDAPVQLALMTAPVVLSPAAISLSAAPPVKLDAPKPTPAIKSAWSAAATLGGSCGGVTLGGCRAY